MHPIRNYFITTDNDGCHRAVVYQQLYVDETDDADKPYRLCGVIGNSVVEINQFKDKKSANRELLMRCGVNAVAIALMES